ncbi:XRE family transcriptional regulator [Listeria monocytogenes]
MSNGFLVPTGRVIKNYLEEYSLNQKDLASRINISEKHISNVLRGKSRLTEDLALKLESIFKGVPASYWLNYETKYREYLAREEFEDKLTNENLKKISERFKFKEVFKGLDWDLQKQAKEMLSILQISDFDNFDNVYSKLAVDFLEDGGERESIAIWLNLCREEIEIQNNDLSHIKFCRDNLINNLFMFKDIANNPDITTSINSARKLCNKLGIYIVEQEAIQNSKVRGALVNFQGHPAIYLSYRFRTHDYIWFALIHELAHLILHYKQNETLISYEEDYCDENISKKEFEANKYTRDFFIDLYDYNEFIADKHFDKEKILNFSIQQNIQPGILVARLQYDKLIPYNKFNYLKVK